jgi:hypothetical protein
MVRVSGHRLCARQLMNLGVVRALLVEHVLCEEPPRHSRGTFAISPVEDDNEAFLKSRGERKRVEMPFALLKKRTASALRNGGIEG